MNIKNELNEFIHLFGIIVIMFMFVTLISVTVSETNKLLYDVVGEYNETYEVLSVKIKHTWLSNQEYLSITYIKHGTIINEPFSYSKLHVINSNESKLIIENDILNGLPRKVTLYWNINDIYN